MVTFSNNKADSGGAMYIKFSSIFVVSGSCFLTFSHNQGGAVHMSNNIFTFEGNSIVLFNNSAADVGGAIFLVGESNIVFQGNTSVTVNNNTVNNHGGVTHVAGNSHIINSMVLFNVNSAGDGGGSIFAVTSNITFEQNATAIFSNNHADKENGGAIYFILNSFVVIRGNSTLMFYNNSISTFGGAVACDHSTIMMHENSTVTFRNSKAIMYGGATYFVKCASIFKEQSEITFMKNSAVNGGGAYCDANSHIV